MDNNVVLNEIFQKISKQDVILEIYDPVFGTVVTGPFLFDISSGSYQRVITNEEYVMVVTFTRVKSNVTVRTYDRNREHTGTRTHIIHTIVPKINSAGIIELELCLAPKFDIDMIRYLYSHADILGKDTIREIGLDEHRLFNLEDGSGILSLLYEISLEECFTLTQLGYLVRFCESYKTIETQ